MTHDAVQHDVGQLGCREGDGGGIETVQADVAHREDELGRHVEVDAQSLLVGFQQTHDLGGDLASPGGHYVVIGMAEPLLVLPAHHAGVLRTGLEGCGEFMDRGEAAP